MLSESDRVKRQRELSNLDTDLQRKRREFQEDFNRRRNEEFSSIVTKANDAIKRIAEQESYDRSFRTPSRSTRASTSPTR